ncbi:putative vacuolar amino acid transporter YPQ3 [Golovinomyces cichoracearum]|uniref:Putative vacuolar amino acid transporter YPQ3 n=1 Tax=Golovinomyces cichoracearum TaxID=62708 RepID=A0A420J6C1_9PEZI|nr:putative vacuolar amino acid transporter YPQ3 [Golovinomyces cichoracearum]
MASLRENLGLEVNDISGIFGREPTQCIHSSISIACWLVVFLPQLMENIRRRSTDGLSVRFVSIWLSGDICNVIGSVLQGVLPTMIILAVYYALVDILLLSQIFYFRGFTWSDESSTSLLYGSDETSNLLPSNRPVEVAAAIEQNLTSQSSAAHLSPAVPFVPDPEVALNARVVAQSTLLKFLAISCIVLVGISGWFLTKSSIPETSEPLPITFDIWGQTFGYMCATLYLSSRLPQLLLNYRRKSTEGISIFFFLFACLGNLAYVLSILIYEPYCPSQGSKAHCPINQLSRNYWQHILLNTSWLIGSAGTFILDLCIFTQFWLYGNSMS